MKRIELYFMILLAGIIGFTSCHKDGKIKRFTDERDGNTYKIVFIGSQVWMAENLRYLPAVSSAEEGSEDQNNEAKPFYYVYGYEGTQPQEAELTETYLTYGVLYNWAAVLNGTPEAQAQTNRIQGICPSGWHLPDDAEWTALEKYLQSKEYNADHFQDADDDRATHNLIAKSLAAGSKWENSDKDNTVGHLLSLNNTTKFSAYPAGTRNFYNGIFGLSGFSTFFWSATAYNEQQVWTRSLHYDYQGVARTAEHKNNAYSVRCIRDE